MRFGTTICAVAALVAVLTSQSIDASASQQPALPRAFGPIKLGMTVAEFKKVTGVTPEICPHCADNEQMADFYTDDYPSFFPEYYKSLRKSERAVECWFYKGRLYRFDLSPETKQIESLKAKYSERFGSDAKLEEWKSGLSSLIWDDKKTVIEVIHVRKKNPDYGITEPVGTVTVVRYLDKPLNAALERQESERPTREHH